MRCCCLAVLALTGCVRAGFDEASRSPVDGASRDQRVPEVAPDSATDSIATPDGGPPHSWSFTVNELSTLNSGQGDDDPSLTPDLREILFDSNQSGDDAVWHATRASATGSWGEPSIVTELTSALGSVSNPLLSPDGLGVYLAHAGDIYHSTRATLGGTWSAPQIVAELNTVENESRAAVTADGLYLVLDREVSNKPSLFHSERSSTAAPWSTPKLITELATAEPDGCPWLNADGTMILFSSRRTGGAGGADIWVATRTGRSVPFDAPRPLSAATVNTSAAEEDPWLSPDGRALLFGRTVSGVKRMFIGVR